MTRNVINRLSGIACVGSAIYVDVHDGQTSVPALLDREPCEQHVERVEDLFIRAFST